MVPPCPASIATLASARATSSANPTPPRVEVKSNWSFLQNHLREYGIFCQPGDVHIHMFGTATLSFAQGVVCRAGEVYEIGADPFGLPLRNALALDDTARTARVTVATP